VFFPAGAQTNGFSQFKVDSICLRTFPHCGSFIIAAARRPLPHAKLSGTNLKAWRYGGRPPYHWLTPCQAFEVAGLKKDLPKNEIKFHCETIFCIALYT